MPQRHLIYRSFEVRTWIVALRWRTETLLWKKLRAPIDRQTRTLVERLSRVEAAKEYRGRRIRRSASEDEASYPDDTTANGRRVGSASGRLGGVTHNSLPRAIEDEIAGDSTFALGPREIGCIKTAVPELGKRLDFTPQKRVFESFALCNVDKHLPPQSICP